MVCDSYRDGESYCIEECPVWMSIFDSETGYDTWLITVNLGGTSGIIVMGRAIVQEVELTPSIKHKR